MAYYNGVSSYTNIYSAGLASRFNGLEGSLFLFGKAGSAGVWTDATARTLVGLAVDGTTALSISRDGTSNSLSFNYNGGGVSRTRNVTTSTLATFSGVLTWSDSADAMWAYYDGAAVGGVQTIGTWAGALHSARCFIGSRLSSANFWSGYLSNVLLLNRPATAAEVSAHNTAGAAGAAAWIAANILPADMVGYWKLTETGLSEAAGADGQAVTQRTWTGVTWNNVAGAAVNTPTLGADVVVNGGFGADTDWTKGAGWTIAAGVAAHAAGTASNLSQAALTIGAWYQAQFTISAYVAGSVSIYLGNGNLYPNIASALGTFVRTGRCIGDTLLRVSDVVNTLAASVDDVSAKAIPTAELFASLQVSTADVLADVNVTGPTATAGIQAGVVVNLDNAATPANFVIAYLDGKGNCLLDKCVAGVYTNVISAAVTYSAGATLRVIKSGTSYGLFYNGAAVGTVQTISDAGIINNTLHGLFSTSALNSLDNFQVMARGTGGEYGGLDAF